MKRTILKMARPNTTIKNKFTGIPKECEKLLKDGNNSMVVDILWDIIDSDTFEVQLFNSAAVSISSDMALSILLEDYKDFKIIVEESTIKAWLTKIVENMVLDVYNRKIKDKYPNFIVEVQKIDFGPNYTNYYIPGLTHFPKIYDPNNTNTLEKMFEKLMAGESVEFDVEIPEDVMREVEEQIQSEKEDSDNITSRYDLFRDEEENENRDDDIIWF